MNRSKTVLLVSPIPPPAGGIANWAAILMRRGLPDGFQLRRADSSVGPRGPRGAQFSVQMDDGMA